MVRDVLIRLSETTYILGPINSNCIFIYKQKSADDSHHRSPIQSQTYVKMVLQIQVYVQTVLIYKSHTNRNQLKTVDGCETTCVTLTYVVVSITIYIQFPTNHHRSCFSHSRIVHRFAKFRFSDLKKIIPTSLNLFHFIISARRVNWNVFTTYMEGGGHR